MKKQIIDEMILVNQYGAFVPVIRQVVGNAIEGRTASERRIEKVALGLRRVDRARIRM